MKTAKRLLTAALAMVFALMCALPALADDTTYTLTIDNAAAGHTYEAYQIFKGVYSEKNANSYLAEVDWGSGVTADTAQQEAMIAELKQAELYDTGFTAVEGVNDATKVAMALSKLKDKATEVDEFNEIVGKYLTTTCVSASTENEQAVFTGLEPGYYLVKDRDESVTGDDSYTKYLVKLVGNTSMEIKSQTMSLAKAIVENGEDVTANNAAMGDTVQYKITSHTSTMDGYEDYTFIIHDELDGGLTLTEDSLTVTVGGQDYKANCTVTYSTDGNVFSNTNTATPGKKLYINIALNNLVKENMKDKAVVVTYSAAVNEKASIGNTPNCNKAYLEYSNNPNKSQKPENSTATTPPQTVSTYVAGFTLTKTSPSGNALPGAQFTVAGVGMNKLNVTGYTFAENPEGSYYKVDGSYVTNAPADAADQTKYAAQGGTYVQEGTPILGMTGDDEQDTTMGALRFDGLKAGTYTLKEVLAPTGYQKLDKDITLKIEWNETANESGNHWTYTVTGEDGTVDTVVNENGVASFNVINRHGLTLPFTGGAGANLLAGLGLALMAAAAAAFVYIKRRHE